MQFPVAEVFRSIPMKTMWIILVVLLLSISIAGQDRFPSHDHEQAQHRKRDEPRRIVRTTPRIFPDDVTRYYNRLNDCAQVFRGFESEATLRRMREEKKDCLREQRRLSRSR
jgi:hypothetical protein